MTAIGHLNANPFAPDEEQFVLTPEQKRAARLRDAAPEMLGALQYILLEVGNDVAGLTRHEALDLISEIADVARAAIAKAVA